MDEAARALARVLEIQEQLLGRAAAVDDQRTRETSRTINPGRYFAAVRAAISEGLCPWCGGRLTPGLCCHHAAHRPGGIQWDRDGSVTQLESQNPLQGLERYGRYQQ